MTFKVYELADTFSGSITNEGEGAEVEEVTRRFVMGQVFDLADLRRRASLYAPQYAADAERSTYWVRRRLDFAGIGNRYFSVNATYSTLLPKTSGLSPSSMAWDTTGTSERIYQAKEETVYPNTQPSFDRAINVSGDSVEGIDVPRPGMKYSETWLIPSSTAFSEAYIDGVNSITATTNAAKFRSFEIGEALFLGARCQWSGDAPFAQVTFEFDCRPNVDAYAVAGLTPFPKKGWEYVWLRYESTAASNQLVRRVLAAYKNRVFDSADWSTLQITGNNPQGQPWKVGNVVNQEQPFPLPAGEFYIVDFEDSMRNPNYVPPE